MTKATATRASAESFDNSRPRQQYNCPGANKIKNYKLLSKNFKNLFAKLQFMILYYNKLQKEASLFLKFKLFKLIYIYNFIKIISNI